MKLPIWPIIGGGLIGLSAVLLMASIGRIAGISGVVWGAFSASDKVWRWMFIIGLLVGTFLFHQLSGKPFPVINSNIPLAIAAGLLVGFGTKLGNGCTSGHGVCGISRLSIRSLVATCTFMLVAIMTVAIVRFVI